MSEVTREEKAAIFSMAAPDKYKLVRIDGETIPGSEVANVLTPDRDCPYWLIEMKSGIVYRTTQATVVENAQ